MAAVTVVGAGRIGLPVVGRLVSAGHRVGVVGVRPDREAAVRASGARWAGTSLARAHEAGTLVTVLPGSPELREVMLGQDERGALSRLRRGSTWIDMTSAAPDLVDALATAARERGVRYVDAAIGGGPDDAARGALTFYVGGEPADVRRVAPLLHAVAAPADVHHMGGHGAGCLAKLLINQLWFGQAVAVGEALLLGARSGLAPTELASVLARSPAASAFGDRYLPALLDGDYLPAFGLGRVVEELDSLERAASRSGVPWTVAAGVAQVHRDALARFGDVDGELLGVAHLERSAGRSLSDPVTSRSGAIGSPSPACQPPAGDSDVP